MKLVELPFELLGGGTHTVNPNEVEFVSYDFEAVHVGLKSGTVLHSAKPTLETAVIAGTPDEAQIREWHQMTVAAIDKVMSARPKWAH